MSKVFIWLFVFLAAYSGIFANQILQGNNQDIDKDLRIVFYGQVFEKQYEKEFKVAVKIWLQEIVNNIDNSYKTISVAVSSFQELKELYDNNKLDMIVMLSKDYLDVIKSIPIKPYYIALSNNEAVHRYVLIGKKSKGNSNQIDYSKSKIAIPENNWGGLGKYWLEYLFQQKKIRYKFYQENEENLIKDENQAILSVFFNNSDYCVARKSTLELMSELNPQLKKSLIVLEESEPLLHSSFNFSDKTPQYKINILNRIVNDETQRARLNQIMSLFKHEKLVPFKEEYLNGIKKIYNSYLSKEK